MVFYQTLGSTGNVMINKMQVMLYYYTVPRITFLNNETVKVSILK